MLSAPSQPPSQPPNPPPPPTPQHTHTRARPGTGPSFYHPIICACRRTSHTLGLKVQGARPDLLLHCRRERGGPAIRAPALAVWRCATQARARNSHARARAGYSAARTRARRHPRAGGRTAPVQSVRTHACAELQRESPSIDALNPAGALLDAAARIAGAAGGGRDPFRL